MRRALVLFSLVGIVLLGLAAVASPQISAGAPTTTAHPLVGTWSVADAATPLQVFAIDTFWDDGNLLLNDGNGSTSQGAWTATGPGTARFTAVGLVPAAHTFVLETIQGTITVDPSGRTFRGEIEVSLGQPGGAAQHPLIVTWVGTRITVQPAMPAAAMLAP